MIIYIRMYRIQTDMQIVIIYIKFEFGETSVDGRSDTRSTLSAETQTRIADVVVVGVDERVVL